jgi:hypothetical protein
MKYQIGDLVIYLGPTKRYPREANHRAELKIGAVYQFGVERGGLSPGSSYGSFEGYIFLAGTTNNHITEGGTGWYVFFDQIIPAGGLAKTLWAKEIEKGRIEDGNK